MAWRRARSQQVRRYGGLKTEESKMPGYLMGSVKVIDAERMARYVKDSAGIVEQFGGKRLGGGVPDVVEGYWPWGIAYLYEFPSRAAALEFWNSEAYRKMIELREGAA